MALPTYFTLKNQLTYPSERTNNTIKPTNIPTNITTNTPTNIPTTKQPNYHYDQLLGGGFFLPTTDINDPASNGFKIFRTFSYACYKGHPVKETQEKKHQYHSTQMFYDSVATGTGLSSKLTGEFTMGTTLNIKTNSLSSGSVDIAGSSLEVSTVVKTLFLDENCYKSLTVPFTDEFMKQFDSLTPIIDKPWLPKGWKQYDTFLKQFGSHFVVRVTLGAYVQQWTFAKKTSHYSARMLKVKTCLEFAESSQHLKACNDVTKEEYQMSKSMSTSSYLVVKGGKDETRNKYQEKKTLQLLRQILNEARNFSSPVSFKYKPVWDVLMMQFHSDTKRYAIAANLKQYFYGFKDFGCTLKTSGKTKLRSFEYRNRNLVMPIFQCVLINKGCHSDYDCHIGGGGFVTYCYGSSCYDYKSPSFGKKAKNVIIRQSQQGSYDEGINDSCYYKADITARCNYGFFDKVVIWNGIDIFNK